MSNFYSSMYNPDVLTCLANLSNDEVFTPPEVANRMMDMLPEELWHDSSATFLEIIILNLIQRNGIIKKYAFGV